MKIEYDINSLVELKKTHPCGCNKFRIVRVGVDIKIKCENCGRVVMLPRIDFNKKIKKILVEE